MCISEDDDAQQQREQRRAAAVVAVERHSHSALATTQGTHHQWRFFLSFFSQMDPCGHDDAIKRGTVGSNLFGNEIEIRIDGISLLHAIPFV